MLEVRVRKGENIDDAIRRFRKRCREDFKEMKMRRYYVKPSDSRRKRKTQRKNKKEQ